MKNLNKQIDESVSMFLLAAKECGFTAEKEIEDNFEMIALVATEMVRLSKERVLTKLASNPQWLVFFAARYQQKVMQSA